jgi:hypothetical protein
MAIKPGTTVQFKPDFVLGALQTLSLTMAREATTTPKPTPTTSNVPATGYKVAFASAGIYDLSWRIVTLGVLTANPSGKLIISSSAQKCVVAVQVPVPSVSVPIVPSSVTSPINGILSSAANGVNGVLSPVNSAVGGPLGNLNGTIGGVTGGLPIANPIAGTPPGSGPGTNYHPTGPTVAQRTVPQGYGSGSGVAGLYVPTTGGSINAPAVGFTGAKASGKNAAIKSGGSPKTVDLAADKPRSALEGWSAVIVLLAVLALSGATAFYARTYLLQPAAAKATA